MLIPKPAAGTQHKPFAVLSMSNLFIPISVYEYAIFFSHLHSPSFAFSSFLQLIHSSQFFFLSLDFHMVERKKAMIYYCLQRKRVRECDSAFPLYRNFEHLIFSPLGPKYLYLPLELKLYRCCQNCP